MSSCAGGDAGCPRIGLQRRRLTLYIVRAILPVPETALRLALGHMADETVLAIVLASLRAERLQHTGFGFEDEETGPAMKGFVRLNMHEKCAVARGRIRMPGSAGRLRFGGESSTSYPLAA